MEWNGSHCFWLEETANFKFRAGKLGNDSVEHK